MDVSSTISINLEISFPIGTYMPPAPEPTVVQSTNESKKPMKSTKKKEEVPVPDEDKLEETLEETDLDILRKTQPMGLRPKLLPYERSIYIFSYKNKEFLKELQR